MYVIDYFNWAKMGDYTFNPAMWPDPAGMVAHLAAKGVRLMVSAWPYTLKDGTRASAEITKPGNGVRFPNNGTHNGSMTPWPDSVCGGECYLYDPTSQSGRDFLWDMLDTGYVKYGVKNFWFDASEPESLANFHNRDAPGLDYQNPLGQPTGSTFSIGTNQQVGMMFPWYHTKMVYEGLLSKFPSEVPVTLARSGWAGTQRFGASNWNGDLQATWTNFQKTIVAGINAQLSGLAWWTHDIGAIGGCDNEDPAYREMLVRWFQFGLTSPIFRQHGSRVVEPWTLQQYGPSGEAAYQAIVKFIKLRYVLRNYTLTLMEEVAHSGTPVNRPLSFDFPHDAKAWAVTDQLMFGPRYMTAPVYHLGARSRSVYFPTGGGCGAWRLWAPAADGAGAGARSFAPGTTATVPVPFDELAMFECMTTT